MKKTLIPPNFVLLLLILFASFRVLSQTAPEENRFSKIVLADKLDEPMEMTLLKDGRVLFVERKGALKCFDPNNGEVKTLATIPVNTKYTNAKGVKREAEEGLMGVIHDPNFEQNNWIYMFYADPAEPQHILARWELKGDVLVEDSKKIMLKVPTQREECCHTGGGMVFDKAGNLFLTIGNNTSNSGSDGYSNIDERKGWQYWDDQRGASNTNSFTGKILRITPQNDGTYTIPKGNLFETMPNNGDGLVKKEIYTMGHRNPWRPTIDSKTGYLYWGEVGPDASTEGEQGPRGYDEFNQAKGPSNFGWPYFIGDNKVYTDWDFETKKAKDSKFDPANPINDSPNNTGLKQLPPAQKAFIWYPYGISEEFPLVGSSGRSATGGPVFRKADFPEGKRTFPDYYEGKWLITDFMRGWIMAVTMDENGNYKSMERFMPNSDFGSSIDINFAPDGDLYVLEYGSAWFRGNDNARLVKVEYNGGNRAPKVVLRADQLTGAAPMKVNFSSAGTTDFDGDALSYIWTVKGKSGKARVFKTQNPTVSFAKPGVYDVTLTVRDAKGEENSESVVVKAGNESPTVAFNIKKGNRTFYFPSKPIDYEVAVADKEDGDLNSGKISQDQVAVSIDYLPIGYDKIEASQNHRGVDASAFASMGERMVGKSDCKSCHMVDKKSVGPSYQDVASKYKGDSKAVEYLSKKVIAGGGGVWGDHIMAAHPQISQAEANIMVDYILNINEPKIASPIPTKGTLTTKIPAGQKDNGSFILRAAYKDKGSKSMQSLATEDLLVLRGAKLNPEISDVSRGTKLFITPGRSFSMVGNNAFLGYKNIDLADIKEVEIACVASARVSASGGIIELRKGSPTGDLIGITEKLEVQQPLPRPAQPAAAGTPAASGPPPQRPPSKLKISIPENAGQQDLYFVFKSDTAKDSQIIMSLTSIEFKSL